jgi:hypothetical protein
MSIPIALFSSDRPTDRGLSLAEWITGHIRHLGRRTRVHRKTPVDCDAEPSLGAPEGVVDQTRWADGFNDDRELDLADYEPSD